MAMPRKGVVWTPAPDPDGGVYYPILSPKPGHDVIGLILSECIEGAMTYYVPPLNPGENGHSIPCTCGEEPCPGRVHHREHRWKGYLACWNWTQGRLFIGEVTKEAYARCPQFEVHKGRLRGKLLRVSRSGQAKNSRCKAVLNPYHGSIVDLPAAFNVRSALERIWFGDPATGKNPALAAELRAARQNDFDGEGKHDG